MLVLGSLLPVICAASVINQLPRATIIERLDRVPCFVVVDMTRAPPPDSDERTLLYLCAAEAEEALISAQQRHPTLKLSLQPVGLGFGLDSATSRLVPATAQVERARTLPGSEQIDWDAATVPLFGNDRLGQLDRNGAVVSPLFLSCDDASAAIDSAEVAALARGDESMQTLEMNTVSLQDMVRRMEEGMSVDPSAFAFIPPATSLRLLDSIAASGVDPAMDATDGDANSADPEELAREALRATFDGSRPSKPARDTGLFPS